MRDSINLMSYMMDRLEEDGEIAGGFNVLLGNKDWFWGKFINDSGLFAEMRFSINNDTGKYKCKIVRFMRYNNDLEKTVLVYRKLSEKIESIIQDFYTLKDNELDGKIECYVNKGVS